MWRLRAGVVTSRPGRLGQPSDPTMRVCLQWLDEVRTNASGSPRDQGGSLAPVRARKHGPEVQNRRQWSAARRAHRSQGVHTPSHGVRRIDRKIRQRAPRKRPAPPGAPFPLWGIDKGDGRTNLGFTRDWQIWIPRSAKADLGAPAKKYGERSIGRLEIACRTTIFFWRAACLRSRPFHSKTRHKWLATRSI